MRLKELKPRVAPLGTRLAPQRIERIRGTTLQNIRKEFFDSNPLCVHCQAEGMTRPATELDHIIPLRKGGADAEGNRQGLCREHHRIKTVADNQGW